MIPTNLPRCPELPTNVLAAPGFKSYAFIKVNEAIANGKVEVFFMPMVSYRSQDGRRDQCRLADDVGDLPDFSEDGTRQCFVWGYANLEDALAVVRAANDHFESGR